MPGGETAYAQPEFVPDRLVPLEQLRRLMGEWVGDVAVSGEPRRAAHPPGCAHVVGSALDRSALDGLVGTVAGDDTLLCVASEEIGGVELAVKLRESPARGSGMSGEGEAAGSTLWHGRFAGGPAEALLAYTVSLPFDLRL